MTDRVKDMIVKFIDSSSAAAFVKNHHYSGKVVQNSSIHFGIFFGAKLRGVMSFGSPTDKRKILALFNDVSWGGVIELNRMACDGVAPRNTESRALAIALRLIRKHYPAIRFVISFSDATASGDGTIYRAAGFHLTQIRRNTSILVFPNGERVAALSLETTPRRAHRALGGRSPYDVCGGKPTRAKIMKATGARYAEGFQLRYIKPIRGDMSAYKGSVLPYSAIDDMGARMYLGRRPGCVE